MNAVCLAVLYTYNFVSAPDIPGCEVYILVGDGLNVEACT